MKASSTSQNPALWSYRMALGFLILFGICVLFAYLNPEALRQETTQVDSFLKDGDKLIIHFAKELGDLGSTMVVILISALASIVLILLNKRSEFLQLLLTVALSGCLTGASKYVVQRARPEGIEETLGFYTTSFPSGHTLSATALYLSLAFIAGSYLNLGKDTRRGQGIFIVLALTLGLLVAAARVLTRTHYPFDCLAGFIGGVGCASFVAWSFTNRKKLN